MDNACDVDEDAYDDDACDEDDDDSYIYIYDDDACIS